MKLFTTTKRPVKTNYGNCKEVKYHLFGCKYLTWTELFKITIPDETDVFREMANRKKDIAEMEKYQEWRRLNHLMRLTNEEYEKILYTRF